MSVTWQKFGDVFHLVRRDPGLVNGEERREIGLKSFGRGAFHKPTVSLADLGSKRVFRVCEGDLLISNIFAWEGAIAIAGPLEEGLIGSHRFMTWVPKQSDVHVPYVRDYLLTAGGLEVIGKASPGSAGRNRTLGVEALKQIEIPLPDLDTQREVADRLDRTAYFVEKAAVDDQATFAVRSRLLADAMEGAPSRRFGSFLRWRKDLVEVSEDRRYELLGVRNSGRGAFAAGVLMGSETKYRHLFRVHAGDLVYPKLGAWAGAFGVVPDELDGRYTSPEFISYEIDGQQIDRIFLEALVTQQSFATMAGGLSKGTNMNRRRLRPETLEALAVPLPSLDVQRVVSKRLVALKRIEGLKVHRGVLVSRLLPSARNEEFRKLLAA